MLSLRACRYAEVLAYAPALSLPRRLLLAAMVPMLMPEQSSAGSCVEGHPIGGGNAAPVFGDRVTRGTTASLKAGVSKAGCVDQPRAGAYGRYGRFDDTIATG
jgi:hypothetical protein